MATKKRSRLYLTFGAALLIGAALAAAFWPRASMVDLATITRGPMMVTIDEEGRTQVSEAYIVSTPVAGRLMRVTVHSGDPVERGKTIVAQMLPTNPAALDVRTREQAMAAENAAEAALRVARADMNAAMASKDLADSELDRTQQLATREIASEAALQRARQAARVASANVDTAEAAIAMREAEVANARALLVGFTDQGLAAALGNGAGRSDEIPLHAPTNGRILRIIQESETTLPAGAPILEIGDISKDLEIVVDLLSSDSVQVSPGNRVLIENWGGAETLAGEVLRVDPFGVTKYSALGVEEQRVNAVIRFTEQKIHKNLGHGFRVEVRIVVWEDPSSLILPTAALFRHGSDWAVFTEEDGKAVLRPVSIGQNNGIEAQLLDGLDEGDRVVLYPSSALVAGMSIEQRQLN
jgi:HlyD family secretion protein